MTRIRKKSKIFPSLDTKYLVNITFRSIFHVSITGLIYITFKSAVPLSVAVLFSLIFAIFHEILEARNNEDNSQNIFTLKRDTILSLVSIVSWLIILSTKLRVTPALLGFLLVGLSRTIDKKYKVERGKRDGLKVVADIISLTAGPPVAILFIQLFL